MAQHDGTVHRYLRAARGDPHIRAAQGDQGVAGEADAGPLQRALEGSGLLAIAYQGIGDAVRPLVHRPIDRYAIALVAVAPRVLEEGKHPGLLNQHMVHWCGSSSASNSRGVIGMNCKRSPICRRVGGLLRMSNKVQGVRPMRFHPPGDSVG